jgi:Fe-S-cluster containining protein
VTELRDWLVDLGRALTGEADMDVPCGDCTACCTSSQFVHVEPDDRAALERIPAELLFPAPGQPEGHLLMGYDERGHCPMLVDGACSIYDARPRTCRTYDCRVFAVSEIVPEDQPDIAARVRAWAPMTADEELLAEIRAAVDQSVVRPLERALHAVGPVAVELSRRG